MELIYSNSNCRISVCCVLMGMVSVVLKSNINTVLFLCPSSKLQKLVSLSHANSYVKRATSFNNLP